MQTAEDVRRCLDLAPHPEGGWYSETFRDHAVPGSPRAASTAIYYLLEAGQVSRWHRVDAAEVWHFYAGDPLELGIATDPAHEAALAILGNRFQLGDRPQIVVPSGAWQQARSLGAWTLAGCTVAPGFLFEQFELAPPGFVPGGRQL